MSRLKTAQELFKRDRQAGDLVFAIVFLIASLCLLFVLPDQATWAKKTKLVAQPAFWPTVSIVGMTLFAALHLIGSICSPRILGRLAEVLFWLRALEFGGWFIAYVYLLPVIGYLPASLIFATTLTFRLGYRSKTILISAALLAVVTVVLFRGLLHVNVPSGAIYEYLPDGLRLIAQIYL